MERFCTPNLPKTRVRRAFISQLMPDAIVSELNDMFIKTHKLGKSPNIVGELAYHPDILLNNFKTGYWLCEYDAKYLPKDISRKIFRESENQIGSIYPTNCIFNNFYIGNTLICSRSTDLIIREYAKYRNMRIINVPQGYTKCSCIPISEEAIITSDAEIGKALRQAGFDVLTVENTVEIKLGTISHGMIGGCAAMLAPNLLGFTGNLNSYKYGDDIRDFCADHGVDAFSLSKEPLYDYGGILPITEHVPKSEEYFTQPLDLDVPEKDLK